MTKRIIITFPADRPYDYYFNVFIFAEDLWKPIVDAGRGTLDDFDNARETIRVNLASPRYRGAVKRIVERVLKPTCPTMSACSTGLRARRRSTSSWRSSRSARSWNGGSPRCGAGWLRRAVSGSHGRRRRPADMSENAVREVALPTGLVDNKVCAIDDTWSGLRLVIRLEHRRTRPD